MDSGHTVMAALVAGALGGSAVGAAAHGQRLETMVQAACISAWPFVLPVTGLAVRAASTATVRDWVLLMRPPTVDDWH